MSVSPVKNKQIKEILKAYQKAVLLEHASSVLSWDQETYMPEKGVDIRAKSLSLLSTLKQKELLSGKFKELVNKTNDKGLNATEQGILRTAKRELYFYDSIPENLLSKEKELTCKAASVWKKARQKSNFKLFQNSLNQIIEIKKQEVKFLKYKDHPYDALLDLYEEDLRVKELNPMFNELKQGLKTILKKNKLPSTHELENKTYNQDNLEKLNHAILKQFNFPYSRARMDVSAHPFTTIFHRNDVRITTRYRGTNFAETLGSTIHEFGHVLYFLQSDKNLSGTPAEYGSTGIHESQSRFWENMVGKNKTFIKTNLILFQKCLDLNKYSADDLYNYFNVVKPSFIRVQADELTYNLHIILRYEMEKGLISDEIPVKEAPMVWNEKMQKYLGITPKKDSDGILQDVHWSSGLIGYFPTYTLGTMFSAQVLKCLEKDLGSIDVLIKNSNYKEIQNWLKENIHQYGSIYKPKDLIKKSTKESLNPEYYLKYLKNKYN